MIENNNKIPAWTRGLLLFALIAALILLGRNMYLKAQPQEWTITSYASVTSSQCMAYTIEDNKGHFVLIDSGLNEDAEVLLHRILDHGGHVDAWILTHPHPDHIGGFTNLMQAATDMFTVQQIYLPRVNTAVYEEKQKPWDEIGYYYAQEEILKDRNDVTYLKEGDVIDLIGLKMEVFSAWDGYVDSLPSQLPNNGSLVFKLSGKENSMLFLSDIETAMEEPILARHKEELAADYVNCAHHGNTGFPGGLYEYVHPKVAFFDAQDTIFNKTQDWQSAQENKELLEEMGAEVRTFSTAPNSVTLR